jgi:hypothetical protein
LQQPSLPGTQLRETFDRVIQFGVSLEVLVGESRELVESER